jgi:haloalkane dehalogenase
MAAGVAPQSAVDRHRRKRVKVLDTDISYVDVGSGDPIVFLHGNPTWSFLWRNVITPLQSQGRCLAPDLVGMGQSGPMPGGGYRLVDHARYLDAWFDAVGATRNVTLVIHDWGSALGFYRARRFPEQIKAITYMEAIVADRQWPEFGPFEQAFRAIRSTAGEQMVLEQNFFVEQVLPHAVLKPLPLEVLAQYRKPFPTPASRAPTLVWPREIPVEGEPQDVAAIIKANSDFMAQSPLPKTFIEATPGTMSPSARAVCKAWPNQTTVPISGIHYIQEDEPQIVADAVSALLARA